MDSLERKYDIMQNEANKWRSKAEELEAKNMQLAQQIAALQDQLQERSSSIPVMSKHMDDNCTYMVPVHAVHQVPSTELEGIDNAVDQSDKKLYSYLHLIVSLFAT
jgi:predicted  nucleic acid-binding Zn-ribbon protein